MTELSSRFQFRDIEKKWCEYWEKNLCFHAQPHAEKPAYSIVIPPPNVTGILHMGHALNNTLQDIIIRYKRMQGCETCWMPGTDHAGIATQNVVEKQIAKEGKTRHDVGREELLKRLWDWKQQYGDTIINQLKSLGASCDWPRTRFTMDEHYSNVVKHVFIHLYNKGLIYRGKYIINWCPRCQTALSDEEAEHREQQGALYYIRYPFKDQSDEYVVVATTRPETMLGDTGIAVHPDDKRYNSYIGRTVILPIINREIKIVADEMVDPEFGTGAVKITPAHDPNDFIMGQKHQLDVINIMHPNACLNEEAGDFVCMDRFEAREAVIEMLKELKVLEKVKPHVHAVGHCYRCHTVVEPYLSNQWFVKMKPLAEPAIQVVKEGKVKFYPERWTKVYLNWMENIRDWCISRQIWWGHRIPVWYCDQCHGAEKPIIAYDPPEECPNCGHKELRQDEDVLDTWFSSWLWPFATFGWPENKSDTEYFYPTNSLFTASEIIFFWVARMIMAGLEFIGDIPFSDVYIHGTVRDTQGRKMSKSLGNALDPLEIIEEYGADALRFSLIINSGQDLYISKEKFEIGRNFANKIWNASRLVLMNVKIKRQDVNLETYIKNKDLDLPTRWIISYFYSTLKKINVAIENYKYSEAESLIYDFFWGNFCDWYLEIIKTKWENQNIQTIVFTILQQSIRMMSPFIPFVTEEIWDHLDINDVPVSLQPWPEIKEPLIDQQAEKDMQILKDIVTSIRNLRIQWNIKTQQEIDCWFHPQNNYTKELLQSNINILKYLLKIKEFLIIDQTPVMKDTVTGLVDHIKFYLPLGDIIDIEQEKAKMLQHKDELVKCCSGIIKRLENEIFLNKAPKEVVEKDKQRLNTMEAKIKAIDEVIKNFES